MQAATTLSPAAPQSDRRPARLSRVGAVALAPLAALFGVGVLALMLGITRIPAEEVLRIMFTDGGERMPRIVIWEVRLPRFLLGAIAGAALAVAGAMLQDALKNELAEPGLLGVSTGASLVVAVVVIFNIAVPFGALRMLKTQDHGAITHALDLTDMTHFAHRALDIGHQLEVLELVAQLNRERGMTIVLVLHDLNQAARYADRMIVLNSGQIRADGTPHEVLTPDLLAQVFGLRVNIVTDPATGTPVCLPYAVAARKNTPSSIPFLSVTNQVVKEQPNGTATPIHPR